MRLQNFTLHIASGKIPICKDRVSENEWYSVECWGPAAPIHTHSPVPSRSVHDSLVKCQSFYLAMFKKVWKQVLDLSLYPDPQWRLIGSILGRSSVQVSWKSEICAMKEESNPSFWNTKSSELVRIKHQTTLFEKMKCMSRVPGWVFDHYRELCLWVGSCVGTPPRQRQPRPEALWCWVVHPYQSAERNISGRLRGIFGWTE